MMVPAAKKLEDLIHLAELCVDLLQQNEEHYAEVSLLPCTPTLLTVVLMVSHHSSMLSTLINRLNFFLSFPRQTFPYVRENLLRDFLFIFFSIVIHYTFHMMELFTLFPPLQIANSRNGDWNCCRGSAGRIHPYASHAANEKLVLGSSLFHRPLSFHFLLSTV